MNKTQGLILAIILSAVAMFLTNWAFDGFVALTSKEAITRLLKAFGFSIPFAIILSLFFVPKKK